MKFSFRKRDGLSTILEVLGIGLVKGLTDSIIPYRGIRRVTDILFGGAAVTAIASYTIPKVTEFATLNLKKKDEEKVEEVNEPAAEEQVCDQSDIPEETEAPKEDLRQHLINIMSGVLSDSIQKALSESGVACVKINNADPEKQMIFAAMTQEEVDQFRKDYECDVYMVKNAPKKTVTGEEKVVEFVAPEQENKDE